MWVYIWNDTWLPNKDTIAYYPLNATTTVNDMSGNSKTLTNNNVTFWTYNWVDCANFSGSQSLYRSESLFTWSSTFTVSFWYRRTWTYANHQNIFSVWTANWTNNFLIWLSYQTSWASDWTLMIWWWNNDRITWYVVPQDEWLHIVYVHTNWTIKVYVNSSLKYTGTVSFNIQAWYTGIGCWISYTTQPIIWNMSELIVENKGWGDDEITSYYNQTKSQYWIS